LLAVSILIGSDSSVVQHIAGLDSGQRGRPMRLMESAFTLRQQWRMPSAQQWVMPLV
jgi:hypothetical protein